MTELKPTPPGEEGLGELFGRLVEDAKAVGSAEIAYYRALAQSRLDDVRASLWMGAAAATLMMAAFVALSVGLVLTLIPLVGPGFATLIVVGVCGGAAYLMGRLAWRHVKRVMGLFR